MNYVNREDFDRLKDQINSIDDKLRAVSIRLDKLIRKHNFEVDY